ncbi:MAG: hypothetical protein ACTHNW_05270 [Mucilaginibacter sp.]
MKTVNLIIALLLICLYCKAQSGFKKHKQEELNNVLNKTELNTLLKNNDFSLLFTITDNSMVYGFIGNNYQRIRIKFITVKKSTSKFPNYEVDGKSMVKNTIDIFRGTITIRSARLAKQLSYGVDDEYKNKGIKAEGRLFGTYSFSENPELAYSGRFQGTFETDFYVDKHERIHYDDIDLNADGFSNNQFTGTWTSYSTGMTKKCNWGDYRIPDSGDLDIGAGEFSPNDKYLKYGWQNARDYLTPNSPSHKNARKMEVMQWWK